MSEQEGKSSLSLVKDLSPATEHRADGVDPQLNLNFLLRALVKYGASDLHMKVGRPPLYRINGRLIPAKMATLSEAQVQYILQSAMSQRQRQILKDRLQVDFSIRVAEVGGFRCNVFHQRHTPSAVIRMIPLAIPSVDHLGLPEVVKAIAMKHQGLVLFTGATGSGKSTSLAALVQYMNETRYSHILTIEDPIEFIFKDLRCSITQREVGEDTHTIGDALVAGLRQDPDVIMLGELRDTTTIQAALTAAETGHLVLATLHTNDAKSTIDRILDAFPNEGRNMIRIQLAHTLAAVIAQKLVVRADGKGRTVATEVLVNSPTVASHIMDNEIDKIPETMENSGHYYNMHTLNKDLERLVSAGAITAEEALQSSHNPEDLKLRLSGIQRES